MATHSSILAWRIPWAEDPGGLQSMEVAKSQTRLSRFTLRRQKWGGWGPTQVGFQSGDLMGGAEAWSRQRGPEVLGGREAGEERPLPWKTWRWGVRCRACGREKREGEGFLDPPGGEGSQQGWQTCKSLLPDRSNQLLHSFLAHSLAVFNMTSGTLFPAIDFPQNSHSLLRGPCTPWPVSCGAAGSDGCRSSESLTLLWAALLSLITIAWTDRVGESTKRFQCAGWLGVCVLSGL